MFMKPFLGMICISIKMQCERFGHHESIQYLCVQQEPFFFLTNLINLVEKTGI